MRRVSWSSRARRKRAVVLSGLSRAARSRGGRAPQADPAAAPHAPRALSVPQDHRRLRLHAAVQPAASLLGSYLGPDFVTEGLLILHGKTGRGKTHLAVAIGYRAIQNGFEALFTTAAQLIETLNAAAGRAASTRRCSLHPSARPGDRRGRLPHVRSRRRQRALPRRQRSASPETADGLHHQQAAARLGAGAPRPALAAILDRVLERGRLITLDGPQAGPTT